MPFYKEGLRMTIRERSNKQRHKKKWIKIVMYMIDVVWNMCVHYYNDKISRVERKFKSWLLV